MPLDASYRKKEIGLSTAMKSTSYASVQFKWTISVAGLNHGSEIDVRQEKPSGSSGFASASISTPKMPMFSKATLRYSRQTGDNWAARVDGGSL